MSAEEAHALDPDAIARIEVLEGAADSASAARRAEVRITTNSMAAAYDSAMTSRARAERLATAARRAPAASSFRIGRAQVIGESMTLHADSITVSGGESFTGLFVIDGVQADLSRMRTLSPSTIKSVEVIKGAAATKLYTDPKAANGVIRITTKGGTTPR
jgi:outer membrane receptor protein involved in Fe transport